MIKNHGSRESSLDQSDPGLPLILDSSYTLFPLINILLAFYLKVQS